MRKCYIFYYPCMFSTMTISHVQTIRSVTQWSGIIVPVTTMFSSPVITLVILSSLSSIISSYSSCQVVLFSLCNITHTSRQESLSSSARLSDLNQVLEPWEHARGGRPRKMSLHRRRVSFPNLTRRKPENNTWTPSQSKVGHSY